MVPYTSNTSFVYVVLLPERGGVRPEVGGASGRPLFSIGGAEGSVPFDWMTGGGGSTGLEVWSGELDLTLVSSSSCTPFCSLTSLRVGDLLVRSSSMA